MNAESITDEQAQSILEIPELQNTRIQNIDVKQTIDFFTRFFIIPLSKHFDIKECRAIDCASGYGWFSVSYILAGGKSVIASEIDEHKVGVAKKIAKILGLEDKIDYRMTVIQDLPFEEDEIDIFVSIETLEHIGNKDRRIISQTLDLIKKITSMGILITTPNGFFPVIAHDTRLPLVHYLPPNRRTRLAKFFGREKKDSGNVFVSPLDIGRLKDKFRPISRCLTFDSHEEYLKFFPHYLPYGAGGKGFRVKQRPPPIQSFYFKVVSTFFGTRSYYFMPSMKIILKRK